MLKIQLNYGWNIVGIGDFSKAEAVLKDPNNIIVSNVYYYDNISKKYKNISSENISNTKSYILQKNLGYLVKIRSDAEETKLELEYYYRVRSQTLIANNKSLLTLNLTNVESYTKLQMSTFISDVYKSVEILDSLFQKQQTNPNVNDKTIDISLRSNNVLDGSLGQAGGNVIEINETNTGKTGLGKMIENENGTTGQDLEYLSQNISIIIHEIMHILGFGLNAVTGKQWSDYIEDLSPDSETRNWFYTGFNGLSTESSAIQNYNYLVTNSNIQTNNTQYNKIPIEQDGGDGTEYAHWEESEIRIDNEAEPISYPYFREEIMSGFLNGNNYISRETLGVFEDLGYSIDYSSEYITIPPITYTS